MIFKNLGKDTLIYGGSDFVIKIIAFALFPFIASALSPAGFGILELIMTIIGLFGLIIGCGLNNAIHRFYWDEDFDKQSKALLITTGFFLQAAFWASLAIILFISYLFAKYYFKISFKIYDFNLTNGAILSIICLIYIRTASRYIQDTIRLYFKPFKFLLFAFFSQGVTVIAAVIILIFYSGDISIFLITLMVVGAIVLPIGVFIIRKDLKFRFDRKIAIQITSYGYPFIFAGLAYWLFSSMDRWMLSTLSSVSETGIYAVAFRFASVLFMVSAAFGQAWSPYAIKIRMDYPNEHKNIYANTFVLLIFVMLALGGGVALYSGEFIALILPKEYQAAALPLVILSFAIILQSTQQVTAMGISIMKKTKLLAAIAWLAAIINFIGNYYLIPNYGSTGAAISTFLSYLFITSSYLFFTQKLYPIPICWRKITFLLSVSVIIGVVSFSSINTLFNLNILLIKFLFAIILLILGVYFLRIKDILASSFT